MLATSLSISFFFFFFLLSFDLFYVVDVQQDYVRYIAHVSSIKRDVDLDMMTVTYLFEVVMAGSWQPY